MIQSPTRHSSLSAAEPTRVHNLDSLASLDVKRLAALYAQGAAPRGVDAIDGAPRGRMLAVRALDRGLVGRVLRSLAGLDGFPWNGKTFSGRGATGTGINRIRLGGRHKLFPFRTSVMPSMIDNQPCIVLDYDQPDNPSLIRKIHDELREIDPGLFLGPAMLKTRGDPAFVLWFALDTHQQSL